MVTGYIEDLDAFLDQVRVSVAPLRFGAGVKGKIVSAMSAGLPVVATPMATEGMSLTDGENVVVADAANEFASSIARVYEDESTLEHAEPERNRIRREGVGTGSDLEKSIGDSCENRVRFHSATTALCAFIRLLARSRRRLPRPGAFSTPSSSLALVASSNGGCRTRRSPRVRMLEQSSARKRDRRFRFVRRLLRSMQRTRGAAASHGTHQSTNRASEPELEGDPDMPDMRNEQPSATGCNATQRTARTVPQQGRVFHGAGHTDVSVGRSSVSAAPHHR